MSIVVGFLERNGVGQRSKAVTNCDKQLIPLDEPNRWVSADADAAGCPSQDDGALLQRTPLSHVSIVDFNPTEQRRTGV